MSDINMTPLIDVMLVLLVIFIITAPLMTSSLKLDLPKTDGARPSDAPAFIALAIDAAGACSSATSRFRSRRSWPARARGRARAIRSRGAAARRQPPCPTAGGRADRRWCRPPA
jgi:hypothetical protein